MNRLILNLGFAAALLSIAGIIWVNVLFRNGRRTLDERLAWWNSTLAGLKAAGASKTDVTALERELSATWQNQEETRTLHGRDKVYVGTLWMSGWVTVSVQFDARDKISRYEVTKTAASF